MKELVISTNFSEEIIDITDLINSKIDIQEGHIILYCPHTTAALTINENYDPDVKQDFLKGLNNIVKELNYQHAEGNSRAHIKSILVGKTLNILIENKKLILGTWDGVYFCEFDGPRTRKIYYDIFSK